MRDDQPGAGAPPTIPDSAPFTPEQRQWLNGFFAALYATHGLPAPALSDAAARLAAHGMADGGAPWHNPRLSLRERMLLAEGQPIARRLMAAMGQQDCRQCGYDCETYAGAIASSAEARLNLCVPGGRETARMLRALLDESAGGAQAFDADAYQAELAAANAPPPPDLRPGYSRDNPVIVRLGSRRRLTAAGSEKSTHHVEIDLDGSGLEHIVGDALGIYPENDPALVDAVIDAIQAPPHFPIMERTLREVLTTDLSLGAPPDALFELISYITGGERRRKARQLAAGEDPDGDAASLDVLAALQKFPGIRPDPEALVECLDALQPRLYSIASAPDAEPGRIALTVDRVRYMAGGRARDGVASSWLTERAPPGCRLKAYIQRAPHFRLPDDDTVPIIMVGPGTGIAPFRAFLQERKAKGAKGRAWLFFGHRREAEDFLYRDELEQLRADDVLTRLSLAWSRDGASRTYVQHRMLQEAEELWEWLFDGAHLYVCGDARRMAVEVEAALADIVADCGNRDPDAARAYIESLKRTGRYHADVY